MTLIGTCVSAIIHDRSAHSNATAPPTINDAGRRILCVEHPKPTLTICGTIKPINPIGPQKAVTDAVRIPDIRSRVVRVFRML